MTRSRMTCAVLVVVLAALSAGCSQPSEETTTGSKVRVGTFDSRCLAMAYYASEMFKSRLRWLEAEYEKAKAAGDKKRVDEMEAKSASGFWPDTGWPQHPAQGAMIHKQGFSTWPVDNILERIKGRIPEVAKKADVDVIISKWDMAYQLPGVELVDVTPLLVNLIVEDEKARKNALKVREMRPISRDKLMDPNE